jgi:hypothetical protein
LQMAKVSFETSAGNPGYAHRTPTRPREAALEVGSAPRFLCVRGLCGRSAFDHSGDRICPLVAAGARWRGEPRDTTVCKCLQAYRACREAIRRALPESEDMCLTTWDFNKMQAGQIFTTGGVLAHRLRAMCRYAHAHYLTLCAQIANRGGSSSLLAQRRRAPSGWPCDRRLRWVQDGTRRGKSFSGVASLEHIAPVRTRARQTCVTGPSTESH